ncbi:ATP-binding cassette domain-containing protein [archaeon]|nr:MAG: ATP-binding cassette domain-containing protein [archaeon]
MCKSNIVTSQPPLITTDAVSYQANGKAIVEDISMSIHKHTLTAIVGPSGSGKTTLLMLINGLLSPTSGTVAYKGTDILELDMPTYRSSVALLFQEPLLIQGDGRTNMLLPFEFSANEPKTPSDDDMQKALALCKLPAWVMGKDVSTLSGGEKQRLCLARTLLLQPDVLLLDEPTSALDRRTEDHIVDLIVNEAKERTVVCVTHSRQMVQRASTIYAMMGGRLVSSADSNGEVDIEDFLGGSP